jgi:hypothetical protein
LHNFYLPLKKICKNVKQKKNGEVMGEGGQK